MHEEGGVAKGFVDGVCRALASVCRGDEGLDLRASGSTSEVVVLGAGGDAHLVVTHLEILCLVLLRIWNC